MSYFTLGIPFHALVVCWGLGVSVIGFSLRNCSIDESHNITTDMTIHCALKVLDVSNNYNMNNFCITSDMELCCNHVVS